MRNTHDSGLGRLALGLLLLVAAGASAGCDAHSPASSPEPEPEKTSEVVCPSCRAIAGGETGDFGADLAACAFAYTDREIDAAEAEALGFPVAAAVGIVEQPIDAAMTWDEVETRGGGRAHGYEPQTHVHVALAVDSLTYSELDADKCDNDGCVESVEAGVCFKRVVKVSASGELRTRDGAVTTELPLQVVKFLFPEEGDEDHNDDSIAARADLRHVRGSLQLDPAIPEPRVGFLDLSLQYKSDHTLEYGVIDISIYPDWDNLADDGGVPVELDLPDQSSYRPLEGRWGDAPPVVPLVGGPAQP